MAIQKTQLLSRQQSTQSVDIRRQRSHSADERGGSGESETCGTGKTVFGLAASEISSSTSVQIGSK